MPNPQQHNHRENLPLSARDEFVGVPYIDQYVGAWALWEPHARVLLGQAENINVQLHLEQHATSEPKSEIVAQSSGMSDVHLTRDGIAVIELRGTLMKHASSFSGGTSTVRARRQLRAAAASEEVAGILLVIDSPGGTVAGTMDLAADVRAAGLKKPLFAHIEDLGASAAYWQASQAQFVAAGTSAIVGSIGVFSVIYDMSRRAEKEGVQVHVVRFGEFKGAGTPGTEITEEQLARWQKLVDAHGDDFVAAISSGRKLSAKAARELATGDVWKGNAALEAKLVDAIETLDDTLARLVSETRKPTSKRNKAMSEATQTDQPKAQAATLAELKEACPGASSDFLLAQLEKCATLPAAMRAHALALAAERDELHKANTELAKALEAEKASTARVDHKPKRGVPPIGGDAKEDSPAGEHAWSTLGANLFMTTERDKLVAAGVPFDKAAARVAQQNPGLREAMREEKPGRAA